MTDNDGLAEPKQGRAEKASPKKGLSLKVSAKGGVSVYGLGRFPLTLYQEQWIKLLDIANDIRAFIQLHAPELKRKA